MPTSYARKPGEERPRVRIDDAGDTKTLVVDGTFASFYRPGEVATLCVWDAIAAPILWLPPKRRRRILVLGLGAGSVARLARAMAPDAEILGVELDADVVRLAREHFELDALGIDVEIADAREWLAKSGTQKGLGRFDVILEDVFMGAGDAVHKPSWIPDPAHRQARKLLAAGGVLVSNTLDEHGQVAGAMAEAFPSVVDVLTEDYDNHVLVAGPEGLSALSLRKAVAESPILSGSLPLLSFRTRSSA